MDVGKRSVPEFLTVGEAARALGLSPDRVRQLERAKVLRALRTQTGVRIFERHEIEEYLQSRK
jgi:excisionase family DNA binding protein